MESKVRSIHIGCSQMGGVGGPKGYVQVQILSKRLREVADWGVWGECSDVTCKRPSGAMDGGPLMCVMMSHRGRSVTWSREEGNRGGRCRKAAERHSLTEIENRQVAVG